MLILILLSLTLFPLWNDLHAGAGDLDVTFDGDGQVTTDLPGDLDNAEDVAIQPDGKIIAVGSTLFSVEYDFAVARYNPDGSLDPSFGSAGIVRTDFFGDHDDATAIAIQPDGKIVVCGNSLSPISDLAVARYLPNGDLDPDFDLDGKATIDFAGSSDNGFSVALQGDGKIVVAGSTKNNVTGVDFAVARLNPNGSLDSTFSTDGKATADFGGNNDSIHSVAIQQDGGIVAAGIAKLASEDFAVARFTTSGNLDSSFSFDGKVTVDFTGLTDAGYGLAIQPDQRIVVGGAANITDSNRDIALARFHPDGSLDDSFNFDGLVNSNLFFEDRAFDIALQPDGKIVAAGQMWIIFGSQDFMVARFHVDGSLDTTFASNGITGENFFGDYDIALALAIQPDGKMVLAGTAADGSSGFFALARFEGDPCLFCDDFENGILDSGWTYTKPQWTESGGTLTGTPAGRKAETIASPVFSGCSVCFVETTMSTAGGIGNKVWLLAWYADKNNSMEVLMKEENDKWVIKQRVGGKVVAKAKGLRTILPNTFYKVRVDYDGAALTLLVDNTTVATLAPLGSPGGTVGFRAKSTTASFAYITVN